MTETRTPDATFLSHTCGDFGAPATAPEVTVVIPQYNNCELTARSVESLRSWHQWLVDILVLDDGSELSEWQASQARLQALARLVARPHQGVTAAWNHAAEQTSARWLIFLNNDTVTLGPWIESLLAPLRSGAARMTGVAWRREPHLPSPLHRWANDRFLAGWCFAIERQRLINLGGFDETLAVYFSDTDLQLRLQQHGDSAAALLCVESLPVLHVGHQTAHRLPDYRRVWELDRNRFLSKWSQSGNGADIRMPTVM